MRASVQLTTTDDPLRKTGYSVLIKETLYMDSFKKELGGLAVSEQNLRKEFDELKEEALKLPPANRAGIEQKIAKGIEALKNRPYYQDAERYLREARLDIGAQSEAH